MPRPNRASLCQAHRRGARRIFQIFDKGENHRAVVSVRELDLPREILPPIINYLPARGGSLPPESAGGRRRDSGGLPALPLSPFRAPVPHVYLELTPSPVVTSDSSARGRETGDPVHSRSLINSPDRNQNTPEHSSFAPREAPPKILDPRPPVTRDAAVWPAVVARRLPLANEVRPIKRTRPRAEVLSIIHSRPGGTTTLRSVAYIRTSPNAIVLNSRLVMLF